MKWFNKNKKQKVDKKILEYRKKFATHRVEKLKSLKTEFNELLDQHIKGGETINLNKVEQLEHLDKALKGYDNLYKKARKFFIDKSRTYIVILLLKNNKLKVFEVTENKKIKGFEIEKHYYNIDREAVIHHNNKDFLFYFEEFATPINFTKSSIKKYADDITYELETSSSSLINVVNGQAFKGIVNLGKPESKMNINWLYLLIGIGMLILAILHLTGSIDLGEMLALS